MSTELLGSGHNKRVKHKLAEEFGSRDFSL